MWRDVRLLHMHASVESTDHPIKITPLPSPNTHPRTLFQASGFRYQERPPSDTPTTRALNPCRSNTGLEKWISRVQPTLIDCSF